MEAGHRIAPLTPPYGPEYSNDAIKDALEKIGARYEVIADTAPVASTTLSTRKRSAGSRAA
jgi:carbamoyltransferase